MIRKSHLSLTTILTLLLTTSLAHADFKLCDAPSSDKNQFHKELILEHRLHFVRGDFNPNTHEALSIPYYHSGALDRENPVTTDNVVSKVNFSLDAPNSGVTVSPVLLDGNVKNDWKIKLLTKENNSPYSGNFNRISYVNWYFDSAITGEVTGNTFAHFDNNPGTDPFGFIGTVEFPRDTGVLRVDTKNCINQFLRYSNLTSQFRSGEKMLTIGITQSCLLRRDITPGQPYLLSTTATLEVCLSNETDIPHETLPEPTPTETDCIDSDGDGWGWDGTKSCRVESTNNTPGPCVDTDGDGFGWNGIETCTPPPAGLPAN